MGDIAAELVRVRDAFNKPTLRLLARKWAPFVIAVFRTAFTRDQRTVPADRLHQQVDNYLDELRLAGKLVPEGTGRALCMQWLGHNWLVRTRDGTAMSTTASPRTPLKRSTSSSPSPATGL